MVTVQTLNLLNGTFNSLPEDLCFDDFIFYHISCLFFNKFSENVTYTIAVYTVCSKELSQIENHNGSE